jgi:hypothetical protein
MASYTYAERLKKIRDTFPQLQEDDYEHQAGLYPDIEDPNFIPKLMRKKEFQESKQESVADVLARGEDKCATAEEFELSSVQKFLSRYLNPNTPYQSALVFHGVGVGKTCSAVTICESYLEQFSGRKVFVVAPPNIQAGFKRTLFDIQSMKTEDGINHHRGCTGDLYLELSGMSIEKDPEVVVKKVTKQMDARYDFFGYYSFYNYIYKLQNKVSAGITDEAILRERINKVFRKEFSNRVIVIDEAHNLRDNPFEKEEDNTDSPTLQDKSDASSGKKLTPLLKRVLETAENVTLLLMTATPMYNSYEEIVFLLNLLLLNDKRPILDIDEIFDRKAQSFLPGGRELLGAIASTYVSFMRGENPLSFPLRLKPQSELSVTEWPTQTPIGEPIEETERIGVSHLPCLGCQLTPELEEQYFTLSKEFAESAEGLGITTMDTLVQAGNWIYPSDRPDVDIRSRIGEDGFTKAFRKEMKEYGDKQISKVTFTSLYKTLWMFEENIGSASGKAKVLLERIRNGQGVQFVYSRFVRAGALSLALVLEANGYLPWGRDGGFLNLKEEDKHPGGNQCALCPLKSKEHGKETSHAFKQARYILLTGTKEYTPDPVEAVNAARSMKNATGSEIKVVLGSQIAGEGLDLRFIREVFVYDSWYHLNKLEQIVGRGIRTCSHAALPEEYRNCTITLLVNQYQLRQHSSFESIDMYSYRLAFNKAKIIGQVTRVLKEFALDCSLNYDAIVMKNIPPLPRLIDSQGDERFDVNRNDTPFSPLCDWLDSCEYGCYKSDGNTYMEDIDFDSPDLSTYDEYTARYEITKIRKALIRFFTGGQVFISFEKVTNFFPNVPQPLLRSLLNEMITELDYTIKTSHGEGRIIYRNGYYLFQPKLIQRESIPIAIRFKDISIPRDRYTPKELVKEEMLEGDTEPLWDACKEWAEEIRVGIAPTWDLKERGTVQHLHPSVIDSLKKMSEAQTSFQTYIEKLEMITWIYSFIEKDSSQRKIFANIFLEYIWDEYLTFETKKQLLLDHYEDELIKKVARESFFTFNSKLYLRLVNDKDYTLHYYQNDKGEFVESLIGIVKLIEKAKDTSLLEKTVNNKVTGFHYGLMLYIDKTANLAFKQSSPPLPGKKISIGLECSKIKGTGNNAELLIEFGKILRSIPGANDLGCSEDKIFQTKTKKGIVSKSILFPNANRVCTYVDIVLRYMDTVKAQGKRWFFRNEEVKVMEHPYKQQRQPTK